jgi:arylsulfatase A-like enzyme
MTLSVIRRRAFLLALVFLPATIRCETKSNDRHVVIVVWDGMRPDFVSERYAPTLWKLAQEGVTFAHHHSVYPTATNVNGAALATGVYPNRNNLLANREYQPLINPNRCFDNGEMPIIKKGDEVSGGKYLAAPTIAEMVRGAGRRTAIAGTKSVVLLHDRHAEWTTAAMNALTKFAAAPMPPPLREKTLRLLGPFLTEPANTNDQRNTYATRALTEILWRDGIPDFSLLWLNEPDDTQHEYSPGADVSLAAIRGSDRNLALVLEAISKNKARETTDIFVVSDHGFSTIERGIDFAAALRASGFDAVTSFEDKPKTGQIMIVGNGGTILFYVIEHDREVTSRLVEWLQHSDSAGVIFAREKFEGTFPLEFVRANTAQAPDLMVALRWNPKPNRHGIAGHIITDSARGAGKGSHATLSEFDVHNTLVAAGPDFSKGTATLPSSNVDIAPTVLRILGIETPQKFDGRVLTEGTKEKPGRTDAVSRTLEANRKFPTGEWRQHLRVSSLGETIYIDEGNGAFENSGEKR